MNPTEELADIHATLSAHTNCATDGSNWRMMWQRLCEQRQEAIRNAFDDGMRKAVNAVCEKCGRGFSPLYRTECLQRWNKLPKCCATCALENLERFLSEPEPDRIPNEQGEQRCQAVGGNAEGKVPTTAPACASESPGSNSAAGAVAAPTRSETARRTTETMIEAADIRQPETPSSSEAKGCSLQQFVGRHCRATLINGDCLDALNDIVCDVVITDPPYGVTQNEWDNLQATMRCFDALKTPIVCTCQNPASSELVVRYKKRFKWSDVWEKTQAVGFLNCKVMPMRQHEDILIFADGKIPYWPQLMQKNRVNIRPHGKTAMSTNYGKFNAERERSIEQDETYPRSIVTFANSQEGQHPTQKPVPLFAYLVASYSQPGQTVCDPFMGSGTTGVAAVRLGRNFIGIERDAEYYKLACDRIAHELDGALL